MATKYWMSFRIRRDETYQERRDALTDAMERVWKGNYSDTSSFHLFDSQYDLDSLMLHLSQGLNRETDLVVLAQMDGKDFRYFGNAADEEVLASFFRIK